MSLTVFSIVLLAALLHASWNFLVKSRSAQDHWVAMAAVVLGHTPYALIALSVAPWPKSAAWLYILAGVLLHVGYQLFLMGAYRWGDLSQVYPLARGVAPLLVAGVSVFCLGVHLTPIEVAAVMLIGLGIMSLTLSRPAAGGKNRKPVVLAVLTGLCIAGYSLVDGMGARLAETSLGFYAWLSLINAIAFLAIIRVAKPGLAAQVGRHHWRFALASGGCSFGAYALVTWAFTQAPIALVTALRETSIIFALFLGVFFLKERLDLTKIAATLSTLLGLIILRWQR